MEKEIAISVKDLHKTFRIPHERSTSLKQALVNSIKGKRGFTDFHVLKGISFEVNKGDFFGIIGRNGCGKSTLLKILAGIYIPDSGEVKINGKISPFLELGVGFNPELSGYENIYLNGAILGLSKREITEKMDEIIEFSELRNFMDQKLKNYSSGMQVRLAFSVAIHAHAPIILLDEVLAVGDSNFQRKCFNVFNELKKEGRTIVFVSHSMETVERFCNKAIMLKDGKIIYSGNPAEAAVYYETANLEDTKKLDGINGKVTLKSVNVKSGAKEHIREIESGDNLEVEISIANKLGRDTEVVAELGLYKDETKAFGDSLGEDEERPLVLLKGKDKNLKISFKSLNLTSGMYRFSLTVKDKNKNELLLGTPELSYFRINSKVKEFGICSLKHNWEE